MSKINQLESLRVLKSVVERGSFTAASKALHLTVARVSKSIERLEIELGVTLLNRSTRHMQLTAAGEECYQNANQLLDQWQTLSDTLADSQSRPKGRLKVSVPMSWGLCVLPKILSTFMEKFPHVLIDLQMNDEYVNVLEQDFDLALRLTTTLEDSSLICKRATNYRFTLCASPLYFNNRTTPTTPEALREHDCLVFSLNSTQYKWRFMQNSRPIDIHITPRLLANNSLILKESLLSGIGIGYIPEFIVADKVATGELVELLPNYEKHQVGLFSIRPAHRKTPQRLRIFMEHLEEQVRLS